MDFVARVIAGTIPDVALQDRDGLIRKWVDDLTGRGIVRWENEKFFQRLKAVEEVFDQLLVDGEVAEEAGMDVVLPGARTTMDVGGRQQHRAPRRDDVCREDQSSGRAPSGEGPSRIEAARDWRREEEEDSDTGPPTWRSDESAEEDILTFEMRRANNLQPAACGFVARVTLATREKVVLRVDSGRPKPGPNPHFSRVFTWSLRGIDLDQGLGLEVEVTGELGLGKAAGNTSPPADGVVEEEEAVPEDIRLWVGADDARVFEYTGEKPMTRIVHALWKSQGEPVLMAVPLVLTRGAESSSSSAASRGSFRSPRESGSRSPRTRSPRSNTPRGSRTPRSGSGSRRSSPRDQLSNNLASSRTPSGSAAASSGGGSAATASSSAEMMAAPALLAPTAIFYLRVSRSAPPGRGEDDFSHSGRAGGRGCGTGRHKRPPQFSLDPRLSRKFFQADNNFRDFLADQRQRARYGVHRGRPQQARARFAKFLGRLEDGVDSPTSERPTALDLVRARMAEQEAEQAVRCNKVKPRGWSSGSMHHVGIRLGRRGGREGGRGGFRVGGEGGGVFA